MIRRSIVVDLIRNFCHARCRRLLMLLFFAICLDGNQLASVPTEIGLLTGLQELLLFDNALLLSIPEEIKVLTSSYNLTLCKFRNPCPAAICKTV